MRTRPRIVAILLGRATIALSALLIDHHIQIRVEEKNRKLGVNALEAPDSNSLSMISTGLNQYSFFGLLHSVISLP